MELKDIQNLIKFVAKSGANEVKLEMEDIKITIKTGPEKTETTILQQAAPMTVQQMPLGAPVATQTEGVSADASAKVEDSNLIEITSPIIGTFYRKPSPDKPLFVEVGDTVNPESVVCIIEAMKLFNEI